MYMHTYMFTYIYIYIYTWVWEIHLQSNIRDSWAPVKPPEGKTSEAVFLRG